MISKEEVKKIAKLARLSLSDKEVAEMQVDLSGILDYFNLLKKVKDKPKKTLQNKKGSLREDRSRVQEEKVLKELIKAAPDKKENHVKVKAIL